MHATVFPLTNVSCSSADISLVIDFYDTIKAYLHNKTAVLFCINSDATKLNTNFSFWTTHYSRYLRCHASDVRHLLNYKVCCGFETEGLVRQRFHNNFFVHLYNTMSCQLTNLQLKSIKIHFLQFTFIMVNTFQITAQHITIWQQKYWSASAAKFFGIWPSCSRFNVAWGDEACIIWSGGLWQLGRWLVWFAATGHTFSVHFWWSAVICGSLQ